MNFCNKTFYINYLRPKISIDEKMDKAHFRNVLFFRQNKNCYTWDIRKTHKYDKSYRFIYIFFLFLLITRFVRERLPALNLLCSSDRCLIGSQGMHVHARRAFEFQNTSEWRREALEYVGSVDESRHIGIFNWTVGRRVECDAGRKSRNEVIHRKWVTLRFI